MTVVELLLGLMSPALSQTAVASHIWPRLSSVRLQRKAKFKAQPSAPKMGFRGPMCRFSDAGTYEGLGFERGEKP